MKDLALIAENLKYYDGSIFWDSSILPRIEENSDSDRKLMFRVRRLFQTANKCKEVVVRHRNALYGNPPSWRFLNEKGEKAEDASAVIAGENLRRLQRQWLRSSIGRYPFHVNPIEKAIDDCLATGYGYLRLWSPAKFAKSKNKFQKVGLHSPSPTSVDFLADNDGFVDKIVYKFVKDEKPLQEIQELREDGLTLFSWEDENGKNVPMDEIGTLEVALDLKGRHTVFELRRDPIITDAVKRAQNAINHALTMVPTNIEFAGFLLQIVTNGLPPGDFQEIDGRQKFVPREELVFSPGRTNFVAGIPQFDESGNVSGYTTPNVTTHDPVDISPLRDAYRLFSSAIYESCNQSHIFNQEQILSGISRQQSRADFRSNLGSEKSALEAVLADCWMCSLILLDGSASANYEIEVDLSINLGSPSPEERTAIRDDYAAGLISKATAILLQGYVDNVDSEIKLLELEAIANITLGEETAIASDQGSQAGSGIS